MCNKQIKVKCLTCEDTKNIRKYSMGGYKPKTWFCGKCGLRQSIKASVV